MSLSAPTRRHILALGLVAALAAALPATAAEEAWVEIYSGWGSVLRPGAIYGRVHKGKPIPRPKPGESTLKKFLETLEALELHALPHARLKVEGIPSIRGTVMADRLGFFTYRVPPRLKPGVVNVTFRLIEPVRYTARLSSINVQIWDHRPGYAVLSDIDDTLIDSGVTHKWTLIKNTLFRNTWDLKKFPFGPEAVTRLTGRIAKGMPALPLFYLSGSPWGLHERISSYFDRVYYPHGTMILRRYSKDPLNPFDFKKPHLLEIIDSLPERRFILLGDTGEKDPEVYTAINRERPGRIAAIYIHNVTKEDPRAPRFSGMTVFKNWAEVAHDAVAKKLAYSSSAAAGSR